VNAGGIPDNATPPATAAALAEAGQIAKDCRDSGLLTVLIELTGVLRLLTFQIVHVQDAQRVLVHVASISRASVAPVHSASPFNSYFMGNRTRKQKKARRLGSKMDVDNDKSRAANESPFDKLSLPVSNVRYVF